MIVDNGLGKYGLFQYTILHFLEELRRTTKDLSQNSQPHSQEMKLGPPEYEAQVLTTQQ
jgi:hypothetical protein